MAKYTRRWMTRNEDGYHVDTVCLWKYRPHLYPSLHIYYTDSHIEYNPSISYKISTFKKYYGFIPKKGSCELIDIEL